MTYITIIGEDVLFISSTEIVLESKGYDVISALGGEEGLNMLKTTKPDLILLDLMRFDSDYWKVLQDIKSDESLTSIPILIITTKRETSNIQKKKKELGFTDYVIKPFDLDELYSKIEKALQYSFKSRN